VSTSLLPSAIAQILTFPDSPTVAVPFDREDPGVRALVSAAQDGDQAAFGRLIEQHERAVFRTALAALGRREDAEEAAQEAMIVAWRKLPGFRGEATFRTWLLTITWRKALDRRRVRALWWRRKQWTSADDLSDPTEALSADGPTPERCAVSRDLARRVEAEIQRLTPKLRDALLLASSGEHSYSEIAGMLGIPLGTLKWRVAEARRLLIARIGDEVKPNA
jgi:RNA polymerase sigma-70 factor (ECF subfamily)